MKNLFLIDGVSGTGKTDLLKYVDGFSTRTAAVRKATTRERREYEKEEAFLDLEFVTRATFEASHYEYCYPYSGELYGVKKSDIVQNLRKADNVFLIIRNADVMKEIMRDFKFVNVVPVYVYTDPGPVTERLAKQKMTLKQIEFRLSRLNVAYEDYYKHLLLFKEVVINNSSEKDYRQVIEALITKYKDSPCVDDKLVFILMSFNKGNPLLEDVANAIKAAVNDIDPAIRCKNLDDLAGSFLISPEAKRHILECRVAIVDLTENKPNVYYELGFAHAAGKEVIITAQIETVLPHYSREYKVILYSNASELRRKLKKELPSVLGLATEQSQEQMHV